MEPNYTVEEFVARGGQAEIYRGRLADGRFVAIKAVKPSPEMSARLLDEARTLAALPAHPNVRGYLAVQQQDNGEAHLIQEWVEGDSLREILANGRISLNAGLHIIRQVLTALAECIHPAGIVHRDLSPANILIANDGTAKVADFGIARKLGSRPTAYELKGTCAYLSPEQVRELPLTATSDLFSVGTILYLLVTGQTPFQGTDAEIHSQIMSDTPVIAPRALEPFVPPKLERVICKLLAKDQADRYQSAVEVLAELPRAYAGAEELRRARRGLERRSSKPVLPTRRQPRRSKALGWMIAAASIAALCLLLPHAWREKSITPQAVQAVEVDRGEIRSVPSAIVTEMCSQPLTEPARAETRPVRRAQKRASKPARSRKARAPRQPTALDQQSQELWHSSADGDRPMWRRDGEVLDFYDGRTSRTH